jgi:transposase-like protein
MDPQQAFCPNLDCPARGQVGQGTVRVHRLKERRDRCTRCGRTFAATRGTPWERLPTEAMLVVVVLSWLSWGCPLQASGHTFALDERTVATWLPRAGQHCQPVHQQLVQRGQMHLQHVQADERWVKLVGQRVWQALALAVPSRLWLGGVLRPQRDKALIAALVQPVRACAASLAILGCVDGRASYVTAFRRVFQHFHPPNGPQPRATT